MSSRPSPVAELVARQVMEGHRLAEVFAAAEAAGHDLTEVLEVLHSPWQHQLDEGEAAEVEEASYGCDVLFELVEHAGMDAAVEAAARLPAFAAVDVPAHCASYEAQLRARSAIMDEEPLGETYCLIADDAMSDRDRRRLLERMASVYPLEELALITDQVRAEDAAIIGAVLRKCPAIEALEIMLPEIEPENLLLMLETYWDVERRQSERPISALVRTYAALSEAEFLPLHRAMSYAAKQGEPSWWLPLLRAHGLEAAQAALHLLESGRDRLTIAALLIDAGYADDDVLTALLENGIGTRASLATLRDGGWCLDTMVKALADRGELVSEVRNQLEALGLPRSAQRQVLLAHWPAHVVDLVLEPVRSSRLLSGGRDLE